MNTFKSITYHQTTLPFGNYPIKQEQPNKFCKQPLKEIPIREFGKDITNISILTVNQDKDNTSGFIRAMDIMKANQAKKDKKKRTMRRSNQLKSSAKKTIKQKVVDYQISMFIRPKKVNKIILPEPQGDQMDIDIENDKNDNVTMNDANWSINLQEVPEYIDDILNFHKNIERSYKINYDYMINQAEINEKMRAILIDWLIDVHLKYKLLQETIYITVSLIDRFLEKVIIERKELQLVGVTALFIASKYEEIYPPALKEFIFITDKAYEKKDVLKMERRILETIDYTFTVPSPLRYLEIIQHYMKWNDREMLLSKYILELCLIEYKMIAYPPGIIAASALCLSRRILSKTWVDCNDILALCNYDMKMVNDCAQEQYEILLKESQLDSTIDNNDNGNGIKLHAVKDKYSNKKYCEIAKIELDTMQLFHI